MDPFEHVSDSSHLSRRVTRPSAAATTIIVADTQLPPVSSLRYKDRSSDDKDGDLKALFNGVFMVCFRLTYFKLYPTDHLSTRYPEDIRPQWDLRVVEGNSLTGEYILQS